MGVGRLGVERQRLPEICHRPLVLTDFAYTLPRWA